MDGIAVKPRHAQIMVNVIALGVVSGLCLAVPALGLLCAMLAPLFSCPLVRHREEWLSWAASAVPAACWLIAGYDPAVGAALLLPSLLPLIATRVIPPRERIGKYGLLLYTVLTTLSAAALLWVIQLRLGAPMAAVLPDRVMEWVRQSKQPGKLLYRLAASGLVSLPQGCDGSELLRPFVAPGILHQTLLSLRRTAELFLQLQLPMYVAHACLLIGLFTAFRVEHLNGVMLVVEVDPHRPQERKTHVTTPPGFRLFTLPVPMRIALGCLFVLCAALISHEGLPATAGLVFSQLARAAFQLNGAAVMVYVFAKRSPDSDTAIGAAVGLAYALVPAVPLIIGISDSFVHYRTSKVRNPDSDS